MKDPDEIVLAENSAASLIRGRNFAPMSIGQMYAVAQRAMSEHQGSEALGSPSRLYEEAEALDLIAAARIFHSISIAQEERKLEGKTILLTKMLAASAYAMHGNFSSAAAVCKGVEYKDLQSDSELIAVALYNPALIGVVLRDFRLKGWARGFIEGLNEFLNTGQDSLATDLRENLEGYISEAIRPLDVVLLANARLALAHIVQLSIARNFAGRSDNYFAQFLSRLVRTGRACFLPSQYEVLVEKDFAQSQGNGIVTLPTSGGKTLIAEFLIAESLKSGPGIAIYIVPYVALGNQVFETLVAHLPADTRIHSAFGGFKSGVSLQPNIYREVIVATPERLDAILRFNDVSPQLRLVIVDEAHIIESGQRGARLEGIVTRFRLAQGRGVLFRLVLLSAVLSDVRALRSWLGPATQHMNSGWRPTARRIAVWERAGHLRWLYGNDALRPAALQGSDTLAQSPLPWPHFLYPTDKFGAIASQQPFAFANVSYLCRYLDQTLGAPILVVCGTKSATRELATVIAQEASAISQVGPAAKSLIDAIMREARFLSPMISMVKKGVAFHNAAVPLQIRKLIEDAIRSREIRFVCATTTLAEGVDLPFRITVLYDWLFGFGEQQKPMAPLLFRNIAGRCGRAGEFVEGDTILFDNVFGNPKFTHDSSRARAQRTLFADPPVLESSIANDNLSHNEKVAAEALLSAQFIAAIPENPTNDMLAESFAANTYAAQRERSVNLVMQKIRDEILSEEDGEPFAKAASPIRLTALGMAACRTGLSAKSCRDLLKFLSRLAEIEPIEELASQLIVATAHFPEQSNVVLTKLVGGSLKRAYVAKSDLPKMAEQWLAGIPLEVVFASLPKAARSSSRVSPADWITGTADNAYVAGQFDRFVDIMEYTFGVYTPWMLRACHNLSAATGGSIGRKLEWLALAERFETARKPDFEALELEPEAGV